MANLTRRQHRLPLPCVISLNGGWTPTDPEHNMPGHDLGYTRYDKMARRGLLHRICRRARGDPPRLAAFCLRCAVAQLTGSMLLLRCDLPVVGAGLRGMQGSGGARRSVLRDDFVDMTAAVADHEHDVYDPGRRA
jgi:hypothetical protein